MLVCSAWMLGRNRKSSLTCSPPAQKVGNSSLACTGRVMDGKIRHSCADLSTVSIRELAFVASKGRVVNECTNPV